MSARNTQTVQYGIRSFDLSVARENESEYELINLPEANTLLTLSVPDEAYFHFGTQTSPGLDLREWEQIGPKDKPFGQVYLENPAGTGTLEVFFAVDLGGRTESSITTVESIEGTVTTDLSDDIGRSAGTVRVEDTGAVSGSTGTATDNVALTMGRNRKAIDVFVDTSGAATLTVETRLSGGTWRAFDTVDYASATTEVEQYETAYPEIRARVDSNLNTLEAVGKGL